MIALISRYFLQGEKVGKFEFHDDKKNKGVFQFIKTGEQ